MIKWMGERNGRKFLGIILTEGNIEKLKQDMPIHFSCEQMHLITIDVQEVVVAYAKTEKDFVAKMKEHGQDFKVTIDPLDTKQ